MTRATLTNLLHLGIGEALSRGLAFVAFAYLARTLDPAQFGVLGTALAVTMVATLVIDQGYGVLGSREIARAPDVAADLAQRVVGTQLVLALAVALALVAGSLVLPLDPTLAILLRGLAASLLGVPFLLSWVLQGRNEMAGYAWPTVLRWVAFAAIGYGVVASPADVGRLPIAEVAGVALAGCLFVALLRHRGIRIRPVPCFDRELARRCLPIGLSNLIWAVRMYLPVIAVYASVGDAPAGLFESSHRVAMVFLAFLGVYFTNLFPAMSAASASPGPGFARLLRSAFSTAVLASAALTAGVAFAADDLLALAFGTDYATPENARALVLLTGLTPVLAARRTARYALIALEGQQAEFRCSLAGVALLAGLLFTLVPTAGITGAAWAMLASETVATALSWLVLWPRLRTHGAGVDAGV